MEANIQAVEAAYEFLLAYAAQGREDDVDGPGPRVRPVLEELRDALNSLHDMLADKPEKAFLSVVVDDIARTRLALDFVLDCPRISSELIDNLNASLHLRAVLTDLFLISEASRIHGG